MPETADRPAPRVRFGPVMVDCVTLDRAIAVICNFVDEGRTRIVMTPNVDHLVLAQTCEPFGATYRRADLVLADGMPLLLVSRLLRLPLREKVSGSDLLLPLASALGTRDGRMFLLGSTEEVSKKAAAELERSAPGLRVVGRATPLYRPGEPSSEMDRAVAAIAESDADMVIVAFGSPKEGQFLDEYHDVLPPATYACLGATLDFIAGEVDRAPKWMQRLSLEWLFRLAKEPRRMWRRYLVRDIAALPLFARMAVDRLRGRPLVITPDQQIEAPQP